ncbi:MAG: RagB/SusD family nutrient uptake outer membrane protein, partial [Pricia sp.]
ESGINMKYLRYSDVLLMMAECENQLGNQAAAVGLINQVRDRAGLDGLSTSLTQNQVFDAIVHERAVELAGEQIRFNDILRWGVAADVLSDTNFQESKHTLLPIPDREISSNEAITAADQNPGY